MKTLTTIIGSAVFATASMVGIVQADELMDIIHPESADLFDQNSNYSPSTGTGIVSLGDDHGSKVWSYEFEQYVNPDDFSPPDYANLDINAYMEENPTAAGGRSEDILQWDDVADEYQLQ